MSMSRRVALAMIGVNTLALAQKSPETPEGEAAWIGFAVEWNKMADLLRKGVFDQRQWKRVQHEFRKLEEKCGE